MAVDNYMFLPATKSHPDNVLIVSLSLPSDVSSPDNVKNTLTQTEIYQWIVERNLLDKLTMLHVYNVVTDEDAFRFYLQMDQFLKTEYTLRWL